MCVVTRPSLAALIRFFLNAMGEHARQSLGTASLRAATMRRQEAAKQAWKSSDLPEWLTEKFYGEKIQPRLATLTVSAIASAFENFKALRDGYSIGKACATSKTLASASPTQWYVTKKPPIRTYQCVTTRHRCYL